VSEGVDVDRLGVTVMGGGVSGVADIALRAERSGFASAWSAEFYDRSASVSLAAMAAATSTIRLGSAIMYAFGRSPVLLAAESRDLDELCGGRLVVGLGTGTTRQVLDWHGLDPSHLAPRLEELVPLLRRLWNLDQGPVVHAGRFYKVKIAPVMHMRPPVRRDPPIYVAGINPRMIEAAGRVAEGLVGHPLFSPEYVAEVVRPALARGAQRAGWPQPRPIAGYVLCSVADREEDARQAAAAQIAFYTVVKTFDPILMLHGFDREASAIREGLRSGGLRGAAAAVTDRMLDAFAVFGDPVAARQRYRDRFAGIYEEPLLFAPSVGELGPPPAALIEAMLDTFTGVAAAPGPPAPGAAGRDGAE
jgi:alkanesulfonate monooxygenase SsuD/methylene tetrahydromethanopterin reductase-like flavin-dependent oxidoreductase (luciferase family)